MLDDGVLHPITLSDDEKENEGVVAPSCCLMGCCHFKLASVDSTPATTPPLENASPIPIPAMRLSTISSSASEETHVVSHQRCVHSKGKPKSMFHPYLGTDCCRHGRDSCVVGVFTTHATSVQNTWGSVSDDVSRSLVVVGNGWGHHDHQGIGFLGWNGWR